MSEANGDVVRRFFGALQRLFENWGTSVSFRDAIKNGEPPPEAIEALGLMSDDAEWSPFFSGETYRGKNEMGRAADELLEAAGNYSLELLEVSDIGDDHVLAMFAPSLAGRTSGIHVNAALYAVVTLREGQITRLFEYTDRDEALAAARG